MIRGDQDIPAEMSYAPGEQIKGGQERCLALNLFWFFVLLY